MGILLFGIAVLVSMSQNALLRQLRASSRAIQQVGSVVLMLAGIGLIYFTIDLDAFRSIFYPFLS